MERVKLAVSGMVCEGCVASVERALLRCAGVSSASASLTEAAVTVEYDSRAIERQALEAAIVAAGFEAGTA